MQIIGIDFGTTTTLVSHCYFDHHPRIINIVPTHHSVETVMRLTEPLDGLAELDVASIDIVGNNAWDMRRRDRYHDRTYANFKPEIGIDVQANRQAELWLKWVFKKTRERLGNADMANYRFVIGIPAKWDNGRIRRYQEIAHNSGFADVHFVPEPIAALLYSKALGNEALPQPPNNRYLLLLDFGGGTLDLSLIEICEQGPIRIKYTGGNPDLGGRNFDYHIRDYIIKLAKEQGTEYPIEEHPIIERLCKTAKHDFIDHESILIRLPTHIDHAGHTGHTCYIDKPLLREICIPLISEIRVTIDTFFEELAQNNINVIRENISEVIKIGGASKLFVVEELLNTYFNDIPINETFDFPAPNEAVVLGLPLYLTERDDYLRNFEPTIHNRYDTIRQNLFASLKLQKGEVITYFEELYGNYQADIQTISDATDMNSQEMKQRVSDILEQIFNKAIDHFLVITNGKLIDGYNELNNLLDQARVFVIDLWGIVPTHGRNLPIPTIEVVIPNFNLDIHRVRNLLLRILFKILSLFYRHPSLHLDAFRLKQNIKSSFLGFFSEPVPAHHRSQAFFSQVEQQVNFLSWDDFWKEFEKRFQIIGG